MSSKVLNASYEPNPTYGQVPFLDYVRVVFTVAVYVPWSTVSCVLRRLLVTKNRLAFTHDLLRSIARNVVLPLSVTRKLLSPRHTNSKIPSNRFGHLQGNLCARVQRQQFSGFWTYQNWGQKHTTPKDSDIVILFIHGGAYAVGHPLLLVPQHLRIAEILEEQQISSSFFALQYSLAPEAVFPTQYEQAAAAYDYLINETGVDPARIVLYGESAGGHCVLALLTTLAAHKLPKPGGAFLLSPWLDLTNSDPVIIENKNKDSLERGTLNRAADDVLGGRENRTKFANVLNYAAELQPAGLSLKEVLPSFTWITGGSDELFIGSFKCFVKNAKAAGLDIELEIVDGKNHGWQSFPDVFNIKKYFQLFPGDSVGDLMPGSDNIANGFLTIIRRLQNARNTSE